MPPINQKEALLLTELNQIDWDHWQPVDTATILFVIQGDQILLIRKKRGLGAGKINGPGGKVDDGESPLEAAIRETEEELCITPLTPTYVGEHQFQFKDGYSLKVSLFRATSFLGKPTETEEAIPLWFPVNEIPYEQMWADDVYWLPHVLNDKKVYGRFIFDGDEMIDHHIRISPLIAN